MTEKLRLSLPRPGQAHPGQAWLLADHDPDSADRQAGSGRPLLLCEQGRTLGLAAGMFLDLDDDALFQVHSLGRLGRARTPLPDTGPLALLTALGPADLGETLELTPRMTGIAAAWITLSDAGFAGRRPDDSGPLAADLLKTGLNLSLCRGFLLPDNGPALRALLTDLALTQGFGLVVTTGGTGLAPRDVTPEATLAVIDKRLYGLEQAMCSASLAKTPHGAVSRAVAGTLGRCLILNLPGSPRAVEENLSAVMGALGHAVAKLGGDTSPCAHHPKDGK